MSRLETHPRCHHVSLIAVAMCFSLLVPAGEAAEHAAEKEKCITACNDCLRACRETCKKMAGH